MQFELPTPSVAVAGSERRFPVHRIYCIGRNYAEHAREMGADPDREPPFFFMKPADCVSPSGANVPYPPRTANLHYEIELVAAVGIGGRDINVAQAENHIFGYAVGVDLTRRDLQADAKAMRRPWDTAKGFECAAPISALHKAEKTGHPARGRIWLKVNDDLCQDGDLAEMIWSATEAVAELSTLFTLAPGDLIFTGTPAGVGAIAAGDEISGGIEGIDEIDFKIV